MPRSKPPPKQPASPAATARATKNLLFAVPGEHFQLLPAGQALLCVVRVTPAAPVFTATSLALDDQEHSSTDYMATGTRAFVSGALSSAVAAGVVGAIWGSEVPVLGNVVGFIIGFGGYYIIDALAGDQVEQGVRQGLENP